MLDLLIYNISELITMDLGTNKPLVGEEFQRTDIKNKIIYDGAIVIEGEKIKEVGKTKDILKNFSISDFKTTIDATSKTVLPGFVDPHTHLVFGGSREKEFVLRIEKARHTKNIIMAGGINDSVSMTRKTSFMELFELGFKRLQRMLQLGTTTIEAKSGYGLELETELKILNVIQKLDQSHPIDIVPTFLGAHAIPRGKNSEKYTQEVIEMLPEIKKQGIAKFCDVFCEAEFFNFEQSKKILQAGIQHGLKPKIHADELSNSYGGILAAEIGAISADHLDFTDIDGISAMAESGVIAVLLPTVTFTLNLEKTPNTMLMRKLKLPLALATDLNPGASYTESMPLVLTLACIKLKLTPIEAIAAATINAAFAIDKADIIGSITKGKQADIVIFDAPNHDYIPYHFGVNLVDTVIKKGKIVIKNHQQR